MLDNILENIRIFGPFFAAVWVITIGMTVLRPQKYLNSILLMFALMVTMIFAAGFFGEAKGYFLLACFLLVMLFLFMVPILLIINGIVATIKLCVGFLCVIIIVSQ